MKLSFNSTLAPVLALALVAVACGSADASQSDDQPTAVVTANILGDVVENLVGDQMNVLTVMPVGADPHDFQASAQQVAQIGEADVLIVNGAGFEEGLLDVIESAEADGVLTFEAISAVDTIEYDEGGHGHDDEEDHDDHGESVDPHFFTDPARMAVAADALATFIVDNVEGIDEVALRALADSHIAELNALDQEVADTVAGLTEEQRVLVTNHEVFGYFANRYDFEVVGTVIPGGSTVDGASAQALAELAEVVEAEGVPAIFADASSSDDLAVTLAEEVGDIEVVQLFSESLGDEDSEGATYLSMVRTNADRITAALSG
ncbi:MAG: zinc ABC transporter substrate-binding protein [Acidimicrobiales bacterium]|nr:zinc ABC transporter substrate-binding protein [Acidimicrobiales bacterium]